MLVKVKKLEDIKNRNDFPCFIHPMGDTCGQIIEVEKVRFNGCQILYRATNSLLYKAEWLEFDFYDDQTALDILAEFVDIMDKSDIIEFMKD